MTRASKTSSGPLAGTPVTATAAGLMREAGKRHRTHTAAADSRMSVTYGELIEGAERMATGLLERGVDAGGRVGLLVDDSVPSLQAYIGCWLAGCTAVHISARLVAPEVQRIIEHAEIAALCHSAGLSETVSGLEGLSDLRCVRSVGDGPSHSPPLESDGPLRSPENPLTTDPAVIAYTSGTSGQPKGVVVTHETLVLATRVNAHFYRVPLHGRLAYSGSLSFVGSFWGQVLPHLYMGGMVRFLDGRDIEAWFSAMRTDASTFTFAPSPLLADFLAALRGDDVVRRGLSTVMHGGSKARPELIEEAASVLGDTLLETWGLTEVVGAITATVPGDFSGFANTENVFASVGRPVPTARCWAVDEQGRPLPPSQEGELVTEVDTLFSRYWRDPETTRRAIKDGAFFTGDAGYIDSAGYVYITGRRSETIITGGMNVQPSEVERVLVSIPEVQDAAVVGVPHGRWGETVVAAVVLDDGGDVTEENVVDYCRSQLAGYKKPTSVRFVDSLPLIGTAKVDRRAVKSLFTGGQDETQ